MFEFIERLTVPCTDDGHQFIQVERLERIQEYLAESPYVVYGERPLAVVYRHHAFDLDAPVILISAHVDSVYPCYHARREDGMIVGTFDNSACNGIAVALMCADRLHPQALVAFTGDEEDESRGADQVIEFLQNECGIYEHLEFVVALDLTEEGFPDKSYAIENLFREKNSEHSLLRFQRRRELKEYLRSILRDSDVHFVSQSEPDESWQYDEYDLNAVGFCLPCQSVKKHMHKKAGVRIHEWAVGQYANGLSRLVSGIAENLESKTRLR